MSTDQKRPTAVASDTYMIAWASLRRRRRTVLILFFTWPLAVGVGIKLLHFLTEAPENQLAPFVAIPVVLVVFVFIATFSFACPRCGKEFYRMNSYRNPFSKECLNCGIRIGTPKSALPTEGEPPKVRSSA
jgi:predicted RNA-binding Zn-ribbon protein involved in translation (DUF1610 family)